MKKYLVLVLIVLIIGSLFTVVIAAPAGKSNVGLLYLYEKDLATWEIIEGGAWGKMKYNLSGDEFEFVFNGHGLEADTEYTLIYYPDGWPGNGLICLGTATADEYGDVHIMNSVNTGDLPAIYDTNYPVGAKIWLVLTVDVDCNVKMVRWNGTKWLFEEDDGLITFDDTDEEQLPQVKGGQVSTFDITLFIPGVYESIWGQASQLHKIESFDSGKFDEQK